MTSTSLGVSLRELVRVDVERQTIDADAWLAYLSPWYRAACAGIVRHWDRMLTLRSALGGSRVEPDEWIGNIWRAAARLTEPTTGTRSARGVIEWRHPDDRLMEYCSVGICWVGDAERGLSGTYLCWTNLFNLGSLGGPHWQRDLSDVTPLGGAAEDIVAYVAGRVALEGA